MTNAHKATWSARLLIIVAAIVVFFPAFTAEILDWDDQEFLVLNPLTERLDGHRLAAAFTSFQAAYYAPLVFAGFAIERSLWELDPFGYHAINVALHVIASLLALDLLRRLGIPLRIATLGALAWAIHPLRVESVIWITERKDCLSAPFILGGMILYLALEGRHPAARLGTAWICQLLSLLAKGTAVVFPLLLLLLDWQREGRITRKAVIEKVPFFALSSAFAGVTLLAQHGGGVLGYAKHGAMERVFIFFYAGWFQLSKFFLPVSLSAVYSLPEPVRMTNPDYLLGMAGVALVAAGMWRSRNRAPELAWGMLFWIAAILPVSQVLLLPIPLADRYVYLPSFGMIFGLCATARDWIARTGSREAERRRLNRLTLIAAVVIAVLGMAANSRAKVWRNDWALWDDAVRKQPVHLTALLNYGRLFAVETGDEETAVQYYRRALAAHPDSALALERMGNYHNRRKEYAKALEYYNRAVKADPGTPRIRCAAAACLEATGQIGEALKQYEETIRLAGDSPEHDEVRKSAVEGRERCVRKAGNMGR